MINRLIVSLLLIIFSIVISAMFYTDQALTSVFHKDDWAQQEVSTELAPLDTSSTLPDLTHMSAKSPSVGDMFAIREDAPVIFQPLLLLLVGLIAVFFLRKSASDK